MATRSTITVNCDFVEIHLYRHWDGYPECTGRHLAHVLRCLKSLTAEELVSKLVQSTESAPNGSGRHQFTSDASDHGDREWHYEITLHPREEPQIAVHHRPIGEEMRKEFEGPLHSYRGWIADRLRPFFACIRQRRAA